MTCFYIMLTLVLVFLGSFIEYSVMQDLLIQPNGTVTLALNQMTNATFNCECTLGDDLCSQPYWSLENDGNLIITTDQDDAETFTQRGIIYDDTSDKTAVISIPDRVENNNTKIFCVAFLFGGSEFSDSQSSPKLIIVGPPQPPEPFLVINNSYQLDIHWEIPYSHDDYPIVSYSIQIVNMSSGRLLDVNDMLNYTKTSYEYTFDDKVQYCQILTVNVTAVNALGQSAPGSVSIGFPIVPHQFDMDIDVDVTFLRNGTPMASITFEAPLICDYQTATYTLTIEDMTDPTVDLEPIQSSYYGIDRNIREVVSLTIDHNYTLLISVVENNFGIEVSTSKNFTTLFGPGSKGHSPHEIGIYVGVPVAVLLFVLLTCLVIVAILALSIIRKKKEWRLSRGGGRTSSTPSVYETINDYQTHQEVKPNIHLSPQQQEFLWKVQHRQLGGGGGGDDSYQAMMSSRADPGITSGPSFTYPPFAAANQQQNALSSRVTVGNPYTDQPCPAAAGSSASPVFGHITVTGGQLSPIILPGGGGGVFIEEDDQEYTAMSQAGTLISQQGNRTPETAPVNVAQQQSQLQSASDGSASGNVALPMYSVVNKAEKSKSQNVEVTEC